MIDKMKSDPLIHPDPPAHWQTWNRPRVCRNFMGDSHELILSMRWWSNLCIKHGCLLSCTMGHTHTSTYYLCIHTHTHHSHLDGMGWLKLQYWFNQQLLSCLAQTGGTHRALRICLMLFAHLFSSTCARVAAAALLWRKLFGPSALQIHLEFMTLTAVCFSSLGRGRRMEGRGSIG